MSSTIASRLLETIEKTTTKHRRNKQLEELTGIDAERWSAFSLGRQRPTAEMLEGISRAFPRICLWLMTGTDDKSHKQYDVSTYVALKKHSWTQILEKEPRDLNDEEMLVVEVENALSSDPDYKHDWNPELFLIYEAREHQLTRAELIKKLQAEELQRLKDFSSNGNQAS